MILLHKILLIVFLFLSLSACKHTPAILVNAEEHMKTAPDSALQLLKTTQLENFFLPSDKALYALLYCQALDKNDIKLESDSLITIATDYYDDSEPHRAGYAWFYQSRIANNCGDENEQAIFLLKAQEYAEKIQDDRLLGLIYCDKGIMYNRQMQIDSSICYFNRSNHFFNKTNDKRNYIVNLLNLGMVNLKIFKYNTAIYKYELAEKLATNLKDSLILSAIYRSLGTVYLLQKEFDKALFFYQKVPIISQEIYNSNKWCLQARIYIQTDKIDSARYCLNKVNEIKGMESNYYKLWKEVFEKEENFEQALKYAIKVIDASDSTYKHKLDISFAGMEKKYKFQKLEIANQKLIIRNKKIVLYYSFSLFVFIILIVLFLYWRLKQKRNQLKIQNQLLLNEKKLFELEKQKFQQEHENSILLEKQLKMQQLLLANIENHKKKSLKLPVFWKENSHEINSTFNQELIACMDLEFNNITKRLIVKHPTLSSRDILICCLLLANFDTGTIATVMDLKIESISKLRYRLRSKLQLDNSVNLLEYLRQF